MSPASTPTPPRAVRLLVIDPSEVVRRGVKSVFAEPGQPPVRVVADVDSAAAALSACRELHPDVVLIEIQLPENRGLELCRTLAGRSAPPRMLVFTHQCSDTLVQQAVAAGVGGILQKNAPAAALAQAVRDVAAGRSILDPETTMRALRLLRSAENNRTSDGVSRLSRQERRVVACIAEGLTNKQAGARLGLSENTVKNYLVGAFDKLRVKRRSQAAAVFIQATGPRAQ